MKVILREEVDNLGRIGAVVKVADGYARNFLIPKGYAVPASEKNVRALDHEKRIAETKAKKVYESAKLQAEKIEAVQLSFKAKAGEEDKLFGSITVMDVAEALATKGVEVDRRKISLAEPIKRLGDHTAEIRLGQDVTAKIRITVEAE